MTTREAALELGVSQTRVRAAIASGLLSATRNGSRWQVDATSVERQRRRTVDPAATRAMSPRIAWALADLTEGGDATWVSPSERSRVRARLAAGPSLPVLCRWLSARADSTHRYRAGEQARRRLRRGLDGVVMAGGDGPLYVTPEVEEEVVARLRLTPHPQGDLTIRAVGAGWHLRVRTPERGQRGLPRLIQGADLFESLDPFTRLRGERLLTALGARPDS